MCLLLLPKLACEAICELNHEMKKTVIEFTRCLWEVGSSLDLALNP